MPADLKDVNAVSVPVKFRLSRYAGRILGRDKRLIADAEEFERDQSLDKKIRRPNSIQDHYDEAADMLAFDKGREAFNGHGRKAVALRNELTFDTISSLLKSDSKAKSVVDFGCHYAGLANRIAEAFPETKVMATDRNARMMAMNRKEFSAPNLDLVRSEFITDLIREKPGLFDGAIFTHTYTTMFLLPAAIREIYSALHDAGCRYIVAHEQTGFSYHKLRPFRFSYSPRSSMWHRDGILLHNYPELLQSSGFDVIAADAHRLVNTGQLAGWRSVLFTGLVRTLR